MLNLEEKVNLLSADIQDACSAEDILTCEDTVRILDEENELWLTNKPRGIEKKMSEMNITGDELAGDEEANGHEPDAPLQGLAEEDYDGRRMRLDYREGRLLLLSTAHPADGHLAFKVRLGMVATHTCACMFNVV